MNAETSLSKKVRATEERSRYDNACKSLLSEKCILARIMKGCMDEYRDCDVDEIAEKYIEGHPLISQVPVGPEDAGTAIRGSDTEDKSLSEGTVTYDIRFLAIAPGTEEHTFVTLHIDVEAQNDFYPGYPLVMRGIYYGCRMISSQSGTEFTSPHYEKIRKVHSVWICPDPPKERQNTITRYHIAEQNLIGSVKESVPHYDLLSITMVCLGDPESGNSEGLLKMLSVLLSDSISAANKQEILQNDFGIPMTQTLERKVSVMCNLSKGVWERAMTKGIAEGMAEGMAKGRAEGMAKGKAEGRLSDIRNLMETTGWTAEQAMTALKVPADEQSEYAQYLKQ